MQQLEVCRECKVRVTDGPGGANESAQTGGSLMFVCFCVVF